MKTKRIIKDQKGATIVEFAIVLPLLLLLTFGIIEFSLLLYNKAMLTNASREGARVGIVYDYDVGPDGNGGGGDDTYHPDNLAIEDAVLNYAQNFLITFGSDTLTRPDITIEWGNPLATDENSRISSRNDGAPLSVTVDYRYDFLIFPNVAELIGGPFSGFTNLQTVTLMRLE